MSELTVIIVTWNNEDCIADCLRSLGPPAGAVPARVIVVDNGSEDETPSIVARDFPDVQLVRNAENMGFAGANNQALRLARSPYILLLNPDTIVRAGALDAMVRFMDDHPRIWAIGPAILNADGTLQRTGVSFPNLWNVLVEALFLDRAFPRSKLFGRHKQLYEDPGRARRVDYVQGAAIVVRFEALQKTGGLDEQYFMYFEETDWCYRMKQAGGEVWYCPSGSIVHLGGGEFGHYDERRLIHFHHSLLTFYQKHHSRTEGIALRGILFLRVLIRLVVWLAVAAVMPRRHASAWSSVRGYARTLGLLVGMEVRVA